MAKRITNKFETQANPSYGGSVKPTSPQIKKIRPPTVRDKGCLQVTDAAADRKYNRGATTNRQSQLRKAGQVPAKSKGSCDIPGAKPSQRRNDPKGVLRKGYTKK